MPSYDIWVIQTWSNYLLLQQVENAERIFKANFTTANPPMNYIESNMHTPIKAK